MLTERLGQAQEALDRERFDEARRLATQLLRELPNVAAVHEVLGLAAYRSGRWKQAAAELGAGAAAAPDRRAAARAGRRLPGASVVGPTSSGSGPTCGRPRRRRRCSPRPASSPPARRPTRATCAGRCARWAAPSRCPKRVRDHHLRQWYVLGDLHDRAGDTLEATRWFELVARHDPDFVDVVDRLRALGR